MLKSLRNKALLLSISSLPAPPASDPKTHQKVLLQVHDFEIALQAMDLLLDDRNQEGTELLKSKHKEHSQNCDDPGAIFPLAMGVMQFIEATLGFETEVMSRAHKTLSDAEEASLSHSKHNQKKNISTSHIYPPGTEFQVTYAELTLLNALIMLLQENNGMVEQAKALMKLRRAYQILDSTYRKIKELEPLFNKNLAKFRKQALNSSVSSVDLPGFELPTSASSTSLPEEISLMKNLEQVYQMRKRRIEGISASQAGSQVNFFRDDLSSYNANARLVSSLNPASNISRTATNPSANASFANEKTIIQNTPPELKSSEPEADEDFSDANDSFESAENEKTDFHKTSGIDEASIKINISRAGTPLKEGYSESIVSSETSTSHSVAADSHLHVSTIDEFIHSGVQLCFGILQVVLSLIPPTIGRVLSIVGFKGNRMVGLKMLWRTSITARNIHGDLALLCLLVFYDGPMQFIDTGFQLPGHDDASVSSILDISDRSTISEAQLEIVVKNPSLYTPQLLRKARMLFPHNALWLLQEGRMLAAQGQMEEAVKSMQSFTDDPSTEIRMEQVESLLTFDRAMFYAFIHDYDNAARDFCRLLEISSWSPAVYLFMAGSCYLEKWRMIKSDVIQYASEDEKHTQLEFYAEKADHYLKLAPTYVAGHGDNAPKKGGIGGSNKQMPFDKFVLRKTKQIETRQQTTKLLYIECVGTSLIHELVYFWNGYNRMPTKDVELSNRMLKFSAGPHAKFEETMDEAMTRIFFQSVCLGKLGNVQAGIDLLETEVMSKYITQDVPGTPLKFTKMTYSPYLYPTALYERAIFAWKQDYQTNSAHAIQESLSWLKKAETVSDIGDYELSNRTSMRIKAASERLEQVGELL
ncbi:hypothetical protein PUMCH_001853 [Australozyma saopauloensis]|uniref:Mitochondrial outer membrane protein IML2 n=1 Tax=Australozyma saopauloensis TaxID=291208 RepID=A0AAX4H7V7_9ASCO|nr:hypothetical protein PUMCH_001853 [[Candida] saopauloensis]